MSRKYDQDQKRRIWRHNSFQGHARMMQANIRSMLESDSITPEARKLLEELEMGVILLPDLLRTRID